MMGTRKAAVLPEPVRALRCQMSAWIKGNTSTRHNTGLRACHQVALAQNDGNGVLLHGCGALIVAQCKVALENVPSGNVGELLDGRRARLARHIDRDVVVAIEVDAGVVGAKELAGKAEMR